jgi:L-ascorbate metabolism protein UlaG (beta-lactamase superfamily)
MNVQLIRHATMLVNFGGAKFLIDPMFSPAGIKPPVQNSTNDRKNPLVDMPVDAESLIKVDAVLLTHTHFDHFDEYAERFLPKDILIFCQPADTEKLQKKGFLNVQTVQDTYTWNNITITRTGGQHGLGELGKKMGSVSGYILQADGQPVTYIAGDTVWCPEVETALETYQPKVVILFAGAAQFNDGNPITMSASDVGKVCQKASQAKVIAVHMEAINHCLLTRADLDKYLVSNGLRSQVYIPLDGEELSL